MEIRNEIEFRPIKASEVKVVVENITPKNITLSLYLERSTVASLMDSAYGIGYWSDETTPYPVEAHDELDGNLYYAKSVIEVKIVAPNGELITARHTGCSDQQNSMKLAETDALKRAASMFLPSYRALYKIDTPSGKICVEPGRLGITFQDPNNFDSCIADISQVAPYKPYVVSEISFGSNEDHFIKSLEICDGSTGEIIFSHVSNKKAYQSGIVRERAAILKSLLPAAGIPLAELCKTFKLKSASFSSLCETEERFNAAIQGLNEIIAAKYASDSKEAPSPTDNINKQLLEKNENLAEATTSKAKKRK